MHYGCSPCCVFSKILTEIAPTILPTELKYFASFGVLSSQIGQSWMKSTVLQAGLPERRARPSLQTRDTVKLVRTGLSEHRVSRRIIHSILSVQGCYTSVIQVSQCLFVCLFVYHTTRCKPTVWIYDDLSKTELLPGVRHSNHQVASPDSLCAVQQHDKFHRRLVGETGEIRRVSHCQTYYKVV